MAEALKDMYNEKFLQEFSGKVMAIYGDFNEEKFIGKVMDSTWNELALKGRMRRIAEIFWQCVSQRYEEALEILVAIHEECNGFPYLFFPEFVAMYGQAEEHWDISMKALELFTIQSSAEFAVRPFIMKNTARMMAQMEEWAIHSNEHVRRLASEGCRPRLPWGEALTVFKRDPSPVVRVLEKLKADPSLYVRKSVGNNLNDIGKDHPAVVLDIVRQWQGAQAETDWILRKGCRTLISQSHPEAMALFGYGEIVSAAPLTTRASLTVMPGSVRIGGNCELSYELCIREGDPVHIRIEYGVDFVKQRGRISRKKFLLSDKTVAGGACLTGKRNHSWLDLTTRRHYPGEHNIVLLVNGQEVACALLQIEVGH